MLMLMSIVLIYGSSVQACVDPKDYVKISSTDRQYIFERLMTDGMSSIDALNSINELEHFYTGVKLGSEGSPSHTVDQAWHAHILNTPMYFEFTEKNFGKYIHHAPFWSGNIENHSSNAYFDLVEYGMKNLNTTIWFGENSVPLNFNPILPAAIAHAKCTTLCFR